MSIDGMRLPPITKELYEHLCNVFPPPTLIPETERDKWMYEAGRNSVLEVLGKYVRHTYTSSDKMDIIKESELRDRDSNVLGKMYDMRNK